MTASVSRPAPWPALFRRWLQYTVLALPAVAIAGLADWLGGGATGRFLAVDGPYLAGWAGGAVGGLLVATTLVWLMSRGSGLKLADLEPERGRMLVLTVVGLWVLAAVIGFLHRDDSDAYSAVSLGVWQLSYFNGLLYRRFMSS